MLIREIVRNRYLSEESDLDSENNSSTDSYPTAKVLDPDMPTVTIHTVSVDDADEENDEDIRSMVNPLQQEFEMTKKEVGMDNDTEDFATQAGDEHFSNGEECGEASDGMSMKEILSKMDEPYTE